ncbi:MAG: YceI family protein [Cyanobacteria bacterium REEB65]|nr:YceI family protein [Cyanobacteria bacterium REEB65]
MISKSVWPGVGYLALLQLGTASPATAQGVRDYTLQDTSSVTFHVSHPMHHVDGVSHALAGTLQVTGTDALVLPLSFAIPVASFVSGNRNRDANMEEVLDAADYPLVQLTIRQIAWSHVAHTGNSQTLAGLATAELSMHGIRRALTIPLEGRLGPTSLRAEAHFAFRCSDFEIPRPALFFLPIADQVGIDVDLVAVPTP